MIIAMTGGTGFLGRAITAEAREHGHEIILLTRRPGGAPEPGVERVDWSSASAVLPPCDAVINLAGETISDRWTEEKKRKIMESRRDGTHRLVDAIGAMQPPLPRVLVSASAVGYYADRGDELLTEESSPGAGYLADVCKDWETEALRAESLGLRVVRMRIGVVLGKGGGALAKLLPPFKLGLGGPLGSGRQWFPWVHLNDVAGLFLFAVEHDDLSGAVNVVSPGAVRGAEFARQLGRALHRPAVIPTPVFGLRLLLGEFAEHLVESQHVVPEAATRAGYVFRKPEIGGALQESVS